MKAVTRDEILDYVTYSEQRHAIRDEAMAAKAVRRIHVGDVLTFLFENRATIRYQILEMVRIEQMVREADIKHELDTYNELLGGDGELGCTMMVEIDDVATRDDKLRQWLDLPEGTYVELDNGERIHPTFDSRQKGTDKVSSVQFLKFDTGGAVPVAVGVEIDGLVAQTKLTEAQRSALQEDLAE